MIEYTFKCGPFYFRIHATDDKDAVAKARRAIDETAPVSTHTYLKIDLTAGAFEGRIYLEPQEINASNICKREPADEMEEVDIPF